MPSARFSVLASVLIMVPTLPAVAAPTVQILDAQRYHLGTPGNPEWDEFLGTTPHGPRLEIGFNADTNTTEQTVVLWQDNVKNEWGVELNKRKLGKLFLMEAPLWHTLKLPPGTLRQGSNTLVLLPPKERDDIRAGPFVIHQGTAAQVFGRAAVDISVADASDGQALPCRLTVVDQEGALAALSCTATNTATRPGVVYTSNGRAHIGLIPGRYTIYATRGFEWSLARAQIGLSPQETQKVALRLTREVDTRGWVSCDTHTHTFTHSRHGDASIEERVITLAGEGIEMPIATDHNFLADYEPPARALGVHRYFTPVVGDEVTTGTAHFNIFPVVRGSVVPDFRRPNWPALLQGMRDTPGVRIVILNHPHNIHSGFHPFASTNFNSLLGQPRRVLDFSVDAMELVNSSALQSNPKGIFPDWFALLNAGHRIVGVGSSDVHDVSRYIVGQGRTYIAADDANPGAIDVELVCKNLRAGKAGVSMGVLPVMTVNTRYGAGDLATNIGPELEAVVEVLAPSWVTPQEIELFANGVSIRRQPLDPGFRPTSDTRGGQRGRFVWKLPRPAHDVHLIAVATGAGVLSPFWAIPRPYQPRFTQWSPICLGATNPIWVDADGDGHFTSGRAYAKTLVEKHQRNLEELFAALQPYDPIVASHAADLLVHAAVDVQAPDFQRALTAAAPTVRAGFEAGLKSLQ